MNISGVEMVLAAIYLLLAGTGIWLLALARRISIPLRKNGRGP